MCPWPLFASGYWFRVILMDVTKEPGSTLISYVKRLSLFS